MMPFLDASITSIKHNFSVNVFGLIEVTQAFFPLLRAAKGTVVNQSSIAGMPGICQPFIGTYSASKMAVTDVSNTMRMEFKPFDVKVGLWCGDLKGCLVRLISIQVVTLFTGDVQTRFWQPGHVRGSEEGLSPSSPYILMKEHAEAMMRGQTHPSGQHSRERWAREVVSDLLKKDPPAAVRRGNLAELMWWISALFPIWLLDLMFWQNCKFKGFKTKLEAQEAKKER